MPSTPSITEIDVSLFSDDEYETLMTWLYKSGWGILTESRSYLHVDPTANLPPRIWLPSSRAPESPTKRQEASSMTKLRLRHVIPSDLAEPGHEGYSMTKLRLRHVIPRFCRHGPSCPDQYTTCHYTHGDTIPCVDEICAFDGTCCASSDKRKTCIRMHPSEGQVWSPDLVGCRP